MSEEIVDELAKAIKTGEMPEYLNSKNKRIKRIADNHDDLSGKTAKLSMCVDLLLGFSAHNMCIAHYLLCKSEAPENATEADIKKAASAMSLATANDVLKQVRSIHNKLFEDEHNQLSEDEKLIIKTLAPQWTLENIKKRNKEQIKLIANIIIPTLKGLNEKTAAARNVVEEATKQRESGKDDNVEDENLEDCGNQKDENND